MPRTPSMDKLAAEEILGPSSLFIITTANRGIVRKWAVARGVPSVIAYKMSAVELTNMYHEHGPGGTSPQSAAPILNPADQLVEAMRRLMALQTAPLDAEAVRAIIREELADYQPEAAVVRLEVSSPVGIGIVQGAVHCQTAHVIKVAVLGHPIMLVGPAGSGKTSIGRHVAEALILPCYITSTVTDTHELMGFVDGYGKYRSTPFREVFENGGVWIADEIDAWDAAALLTANSALANGIASFPDGAAPIARHPNFRMIATANTYGHGADRVYVGRNELDAASLDRFAMIAIDYDNALERQFAGGNEEWFNRVLDVRAKVIQRNIRHVVSSRAIIFGAQALAAGFDWISVENMYLFKGMSKTDREKVA